MSLLFVSSALSASPEIHGIQPQGGPVRGGTQIKVTGKDLDDLTMMCMFGNTENELELVSVTCRYDTTLPVAVQGQSCLCIAPNLALLPGGWGIGQYLAGKVLLTVAPSGAEPQWTPFPTYFTYYELNNVINITSIQPSAGDSKRSTLVTIHGNGFANYGGVFCSFPGALWDRDMDPHDPDYQWRSFTAPATLVHNHMMLCRLPSGENNTSPVFLEVCLNGHPDEASPMGRRYRDEFCTASLHVFTYVDLSWQNFTVWNTSTIAGPVDGGTVVVLNTRDAHSPGGGVPNYGRPTCLFGDATAPAMLQGYAPLMYTPAAGTAPLLTYGAAPIAAHVARQRMCKGASQEEMHSYCSCSLGGALCGCGCREMLPRYGLFLDQCDERGTFVFNPETGEDERQVVVFCGPAGASWHAPIQEKRGSVATCIAPPHLAGKVALEYSPSGDPHVATSSGGRRIKFEYYESLLEGIRPRGAPLEGQTALTVSGRNLWAFGVATISAVNGSARVYDDEPLCLFVDVDVATAAGVNASEMLAGEGVTYHNSTASLVGCEVAGATPGWNVADDVVACASNPRRPCEPSGCATLVCAEVPPRASPSTMQVFVALNGRADSAEPAGLLSYFDNSLVFVSSHTPLAGPTAGGTTIQLHGTGLAALGTWSGNGDGATGAACLMCDARLSNCEGLIRALPAAVHSDGYATCNTTADDAAADSTGGRELTLGLSLNAQPNALKAAEVSAWYFADVTAVRVSAVAPLGGPIRGGGPVLLKGLNLRSCNGGDCPAPPLCRFDFVEPDGPASQLVAGEVQQVVFTRTGGAQTVVNCAAPSSGLVSQALTGRTLSEARRRVAITFAPLGHMQPEALVADAAEYLFYDDILSRVMPLGGPRDGGTTVSLVGSGFFEYTIEEVALQGGVQVWPTPLCVWLYRGALADTARAEAVAEGADADQALVMATAVAATGADHVVTCTAPKRPFDPGAAELEETSLELSLNGLSTDRTDAGVVYTYYQSSVSHLLPVGGPAAGGTVLTLQGSGLVDLGGYLPGGGLRCAFSLPELSTLAHPEPEVAAAWRVEVRGTQQADGTISCVTPRLDAADEAPARVRTTNASVSLYVQVQLSLNGDPAGAVSTAECVLVKGVPPSAPPNEAMGPTCFGAYRAPADASLTTTFPLGGPHRGGTRVTLRGKGFTPLGGAGTHAGLGCRFGSAAANATGGDDVDEAWQQATLVSPTELRCIAPANGPLPSSGRVAVEVTLNGRNALPIAADDATDGANTAVGAHAADGAVRFAFYNAERVVPLTLEPTRGGAAGSTLVTLHGTGFVDLGGLLCRFGELPPTAATRVDVHRIVCRSPPNVYVPWRAFNVTTAAAHSFADESPATATVASDPVAESNATGAIAVAPPPGHPPPLPPPLPPEPSVPVRVVLNGEVESGTGFAPTFHFVDEPCASRTTLAWPAGALADGLLGREQYTAARNCSWLIAPRGRGNGPLLLILTHATLERGLDSVAVHAGEDDAAPLLRKLPEPVGTDADQSFGCGRAEGTCMESIIAERGPIFVRLLAAARALREPATDVSARHSGAPAAVSTARFSAVYFTD